VFFIHKNMTNVRK